MLAVLFIPLMFPLLWVCVSATTGVLVGGEEVMETFTTSMALAGGYDVIMILVSWVLYDFVVGSPSLEGFVRLRAGFSEATAGYRSPLARYAPA